MAALPLLATMPPPALQQAVSTDLGGPELLDLCKLAQEHPPLGDVGGFDRDGEDGSRSRTFGAVKFVWLTRFSIFCRLSYGDAGC